MNMHWHTLLAGCLLAASVPLAAADISHGKALQQKHCMACHDNGMYTRDYRRVTSMAGLRNQVKRCELTLGLQWFDEDIDDVTAYLNETFYKIR